MCVCVCVCVCACVCVCVCVCVCEGQICLGKTKCTLCHTEVEIADRTCYLTQSQYTDTGPTSPSDDPTTPTLEYQFSSHWYDPNLEKAPRGKRRLNAAVIETGHLSTTPTRRSLTSRGFGIATVVFQWPPSRVFPALGCCLWLVGCLTSQQHASVSQGRICSDNFTCCHTEVEAADRTFYLTQSQYTDTRPTSPSADPRTPGA